MWSQDSFKTNRARERAIMQAEKKPWQVELEQGSNMKTQRKKQAKIKNVTVNSKTEKRL